MFNPANHKPGRMGYSHLADDFLKWTIRDVSFQIDGLNCPIELFKVGSAI